jgi:hypothetical protein
MTKVDEKLNAEIRRYIDELPDNHNFGEYDINYLGRYTGCIDAFISKRLIDQAWHFLKGKFTSLELGTDIDNPYPVSVMHTNSGGGYILRYAPKNAVLTAYNNDYYCYVISKALFSKQENRDNFEAVFGDISEYFIGKYHGDNIKYDIVFAQPDKESNYYEIDDDRKYSSLNPFLYYTLRGMFFLKNGGWLCSILPKSEADKLSEAQKKYENLCPDRCSVHKIIRTDDSDYVALLIHKLKKV